MDDAQPPEPFRNGVCLPDLNPRSGSVADDGYVGRCAFSAGQEYRDGDHNYLRRRNSPRATKPSTPAGRDTHRERTDPGRALLQQGTLSRVRWYVPTRRVGNAVRRALAVAGLPEGGTLMVEVKTIEPGIPVYGKAHLATSSHAA